RRGELVSPERVDIRARNHPHVLEAYSVGVPDAVHGERLVTACLLKDGGTSEHVETYLRAHLSPSHCPDLVLALAQFPRTETGKVDGRRLKGLISGESSMHMAQRLSRYKVSRYPLEDPSEVADRFQRAAI